MWEKNDYFEFCLGMRLQYGTIHSTLCGHGEGGGGGAGGGGSDRERSFWFDGEEDGGKERRGNNTRFRETRSLKRGPSVKKKRAFSLGGKGRGERNFPLECRSERKIGILCARGERKEEVTADDKGGRSTVGGDTGGRGKELFLEFPQNF